MREQAVTLTAAGASLGPAGPGSAECGGCDWYCCACMKGHALGIVWARAYAR
jgi:hypothetical protein